ncbi:MAG: hypothetical protein WAM66_10220 [Acidobacteriaceae bacterium]
MVNDRAGAPPGVIVAAVVLAVMAFVGLLIAACAAYVMFATKSALIPRIPSVRMVAGGLDVLILALAILAAFTIVGLFRLKIWARYSITWLGLLDLVVFGLMAAGVLVVRAKSGMAAISIPTNPGITLGEIMLGLAGLYVALALIGVWWMIYFNTTHMRLAFADANVEPRPLIQEESSSKSFPGIS